MILQVVQLSPGQDPRVVQLSPGQDPTLYSSSAQSRTGSLSAEHFRKKQKVILSSRAVHERNIPIHMPRVQYSTVKDLKPQESNCISVRQNFRICRNFKVKIYVKLFIVVDV